MNQTEVISHIKILHNKGIELIKSKGHDYADPDLDSFRNFRSSFVIGIDYKKAIIIRVLDKLSRISNLLDKEAMVKSESLEDAIIDSQNYLGLLSAALEDERRKQQKLQ